MQHRSLPPLDGLRRHLRAHAPRDSFVRETFTLPLGEARAKARE